MRHDEDQTCSSLDSLCDIRYGDHILWEFHIGEILFIDMGRIDDFGQLFPLKLVSSAFSPPLHSFQKHSHEKERC